MQRLRRTARRTCVVLGWVLLGCGALLYAAERSGALRSVLEGVLAELAPSDAGDLSIESVGLDWFEPALVLDGVRLEHDGITDAHVERARLVFAPWLGRTLGLERVEVQGARLRLSPSLSMRARNLMQGGSPARLRRGGASRLPSLVVDRLDVELATPDWGVWPVGEVDLRYSSAGDAPARISGRLAARSWWAGDSARHIHILGSEVEPGVLDLSAVARGLTLDLDDVPGDVPLGELERLHPAARLDLQAEGRIHLDGSAPPTGFVRLALADGVLQPPDVSEPVRDLALDLEAAFTPESTQTLFDVAAWDVRARVDARWHDNAVAVTARAGAFARPGFLAETWLRVAELHVPAERVDETAALLFPIPGIADLVAYGLGARGRAALTVALALDEDWTPEHDVHDALHELVHVRSQGGAEVSYHGWPDADGVRKYGFPLAVRGVSGDFVFGHHPRRPQRGLIGLVDLRGDHGAGPVRCDGLISSLPPGSPEPGPPLGLDLDIRAEGLAIDERLRTAAHGLRGVVPEDELWGLYSPEGGDVDLGLRFVMEPGREHLAAAVGLGLRDVTLRWAPVPVPLTGTRGRVDVVTDGRGHAVSRVRTASRLASAEALDLTVRTAAGRDVEEVQYAEARVHRLSLRGDDLRVLATQLDAVRGALEDFSPKGFVDARCEWSARGEGGDTALTVDLTPSGPCEIDPRVFTMNTRELRGRILVGARRVRPPSDESGERWAADVRALPLLGTWGAGIDVALGGEFATGSAGRLTLHGAGIESANRRLLGSLAESLAAAGAGGGRIDLTSLRVDGRLDFGAELRFAERDGGTRITPDSEFLVFLRENDLVSERGFSLERLDGRVHLDLEEGRLSAEQLDAVLGRTSVRLADARLERVDDLLRFTTRLDAQGLPLDREHLSLFLEEETLTALLTELSWRGTIDVHDAELTFDSLQDGTTRLSLRGPATLSDVFVQVGVPVSIRSAQANVDRLVFEDGTTRGWGHLSDLFGTVAGRSLESTEMLVSYVEPRVSLENVDGRLIDGEGRVTPLGAGAGGVSAGGSAFAIDLRAPFPFDAAFAVQNVDVAGLTQGLFAADIANSGRVDGEVRLSGNLEQLLDIRGSGRLALTRGQLWSVPVVRTLFSQLGLDDTAVFDSMGTRFDISSGVIHMRELEAHSPILKLVGSGTLDFDGRLHHDLEVNYGLVDKLGFLRKFLYWIQNSLLRIAIRGDMERPQVIFQNVLSDLRGERERRSLPLPDVTGLPRRF